MTFVAPFERMGEDRYLVHLTPGERAVLAGLAERLEAMISSDPEAAVVARLFPPASRNDAGIAAEYRALVGDELVAAHRGTLSGLVSGAAEVGELDGEQLDAWARALNAMRLALGSALGLDRDEDERARGEDAATIGFADGSGIEALLDLLGWEGAAPDRSDAPGKRGAGALGGAGSDPEVEELGEELFHYLGYLVGSLVEAVQSPVPPGVDAAGEPEGAA